jgi:hypothetical protein
MLNQAIYIRLLTLFRSLSMVQRIKLFNINVEDCRPIIPTSNQISIQYFFNKYCRPEKMMIEKQVPF